MINYKCILPTLEDPLKKLRGIVNKSIEERK